MTTMSRRPWAPAEIERLVEVYPHLKSAEIAHALNRSLRSVYSKAAELGVKKSAPQMAGLGAGRQATQFKPGHRPQTWRPIGSDRYCPRGYRDRKIADTGVTARDYVPVAHLVWRMHGHTVPPGHALVFRDGNRNNPDINNLELVTRAELMRRNSVHTLPVELKELVSLKGRLSRTITMLEKNSHEQ